MQNVAPIYLIYMIPYSKTEHRVKVTVKLSCRQLPFLYIARFSLSIVAVYLPDL